MPTLVEWYLFAYVVSFGLEIIRKVFSNTSMNENE